MTLLEPQNGSQYVFCLFLTVLYIIFLEKKTFCWRQNGVRGPTWGPYSLWKRPCPHGSCPVKQIISNFDVLAHLDFYLVKNI